MAKQFGLVREIKLVGNFYEAEGFPFKFSRYYYEKLGIPRKPGETPRLAAPFIAAEEVFKTATTITKD